MALEFTLKLKDLLTGNLSKAAKTADGNLLKLQRDADTAGNKIASSIDGINRKFASLGKIIAGVEIGRIATEFAKSSLEAAHTLHMAEAQLLNTMQNRGYSREAYDNAVEDAGRLSKNILYSKQEVIGLESQLRLVGNISEKEMGRMAKASADMATKFHMGLDEAGNAIAKAVNNPEMLRRLGMQLKIDPAVQVYLQNLAKHGKEAQARLELLNIVEQKVGGSAEAAFNTDPLGKYNKTLEDLKITAGNTLTPILANFADLADHTLKFLNLSESVPDKLRTEKGAVDTLVGAITSLNEGNATRKSLLTELVHNYPDLFKGIDAEKTKNSELLSMLKSVNYEFGQRIDLAQKAYNLDVANDDYNDLIGRAGRVKSQIQRFKDHPEEQNAFFPWSYKYLTLRDLHDIKQSKAGPFTSYYAGNIAGLQGYYDNTVAPQELKAEKLKQRREIESRMGNVNAIFDQVSKLKYDADALETAIPDANKRAEFTKLARQLHFNNGKYTADGNWTYGTLSNRFSSLLNPGSTSADGAGGGAGGTGKLTSGAEGAMSGQRTITINIKSFVEKFELATVSTKEGISEIEQLFKEMFLRVVNSATGASVN